MRRTRARVLGGAALVLMFALIAGVPAAPPAAAHHQGVVHPMGRSVNETVVIPFNNWTAYEADVVSSNRVLYDIRVTSGTEIDLYVVPQSGFVLYQDDASLSFTYYDRVENSLVIQGSFSGANGKVFFIVDNVDLTGARPRGDVTVHVSLAPPVEPPPPLWPFLFCGGLVAVAIATFALVVAHNRRKRRAAVPPLPPPTAVPGVPPLPVPQAPPRGRVPPPPPPPPPD